MSLYNIPDEFFTNGFNTIPTCVEKQLIRIDGTKFHITKKVPNLPFDIIGMIFDILVMEERKVHQKRFNYVLFQLTNANINNLIIEYKRREKQRDALYRT